MKEELRDLRVVGVTGAVRTETYLGREHIVVPCVALMEGVVQAVNAPTKEFVPQGVLARAARSWNGRPAVLWHPTSNGQQISANDPEVLAAHGMGTLFNSHMEGKKMHMEAWLDPERVEALGGLDLLEQIKNATAPIEVSVGSFVLTDSKPGTYEGKRYESSWTTALGDHLALLPGGQGACSVEMGCGTHRSMSVNVIDGEHLTSFTPDEWEKRSAGGPGSGWSASGGHVPGSQSKEAHDKASAAHNAAASAHDKAAEAHYSGTSNAVTSAEKDAHAATSKAQAATKATGSTVYGSQGAGAYDKLATSSTDSKQASTYHKQAAQAHRDAAATHQKYKSYKTMSAPLLKGRSLRERVKALIGLKNLDAADGDPTPSEDGDATAELIGYDTIQTLFDQVCAQHDQADKLLKDLISDEAEASTDEEAEEEIECARLEAIQTLCSSMASTLSSVVSITYKMMLPDLPDTASPRYAEELRTAIGKRNSKSDQSMIQDMHDNAVLLGADCAELKTEAAHACGCGNRAAQEGDTMTKEERAATIKSLTTTKDSGYGSEDTKWLEGVPDARLEAMSELLKGGLRAAASKADAEKVISDKATADKNLATHAAMLEAQNKKAAGGNEPDPKAMEARAAAAKAAGLTLEQFDEKEYLKTAPKSIQNLAAREEIRVTNRRAELITALEALKTLSKAELELKSLDDLETIAKFAKVAEPEADYSGRGMAMRAESAEDPHANPPNGYEIAAKARREGKK